MACEAVQWECLYALNPQATAAQIQSPDHHSSGRSVADRHRVVVPAGQEGVGHGEQRCLVMPAVVCLDSLCLLRAGSIKELTLAPRLLDLWDQSSRPAARAGTLLDRPGSPGTPCLQDLWGQGKATGQLGRHPNPPGPPRQPTPPTHWMVGTTDAMNLRNRTR